MMWQTDPARNLSTGFGPGVAFCIGQLSAEPLPRPCRASAIWLT
jgi:hypothetical protein